MQEEAHTKRLSVVVGVLFAVLAASVALPQQLMPSKPLAPQKPPLVSKSVGTQELPNKAGVKGRQVPIGIEPKAKQITTQPLVMTGYRFNPKLISTATLTMSGTGFPHRDLRTEALVMSGVGFSHQQIDTQTIVMTGSRFPHQSISTGALIMTGTRR